MITILQFFAGLLVVKGAQKILITLGVLTPRRPLLKQRERRPPRSRNPKFGKNSGMKVTTARVNKFFSSESC